GWLDDEAARLAVRLKLDEALLLRFPEQIGERAEAVIGLVESGITAFERLLHHRAPDLLVRPALGDQRLERAEHDVESFLLLVLGRRRSFLALLRRAALLLVLAHEIVVVDELVAIRDEQVRARVLHA